VKNDLQLIDETLAGRREAFGELVLRHQNRLYTTLVHVTGSAAEAEDVVQEAFVQAFLKLSTFQGTSSFYTWLYRIAFNFAVSRRRRRRPELSVDEHRELGGPEPIDGQLEACEQLERDEGVQRVRAAMAQLSDEHRTILILREMEGCCYETIAELLGLPVGTVRSRIHRARSQLREILKEDLQEHP
jgi:RNA polymerase sigma-70 factor, ECF subfamily